jgi:CRP-like cAMP-binding protein
MSSGQALDDTLAQVGIFRDLSPAQRAMLARSLNEVRFRQGEWIFRQGDENASLYIIIEGEAAVVINDEQRSILSTGSVFGEISALLAEPTTADVWARTPLRCIVVQPSELENFLVSNPVVMFRILQAEARRLRGADLVRT